MNHSMILHPEELSSAWIRKLKEAGVSVLGIHPRGGRRAHESLAELVAKLKTKEYRRLIDEAQSCGLEIEYELHGAGYLMPRDRFGEKPNYFRTNEAGERTADYNFCVTNEAALELYARRGAQLARDLYGSNGNFYFWMDDGRGLCCHCPKCRELSPSDQQMLVLKRVLEEIRKEIPRAKLSYLAYMDTLEPPTKVKGAEGIFLEYAPFEKYTAQGEDAAARIQGEREKIAPLMAYFQAESKKVLEYWYDNSLFSKWKKPPAPFCLNEEAMVRDVREYRRMGFDCISTFACYLGEDYQALYGDVDVRPFAEALGKGRDKR